MFPLTKNGYKCFHRRVSYYYVLSIHPALDTGLVCSMQCFVRYYHALDWLLSNLKARNATISYHEFFKSGYLHVGCLWEQFPCCSGDVSVTVLSRSSESPTYLIWMWSFPQIIPFPSLLLPFYFSLF